MSSKNIQNTNPIQRNSYIGEFNQERFNEILEEKDKQIKQLKKTIKKLNKQLKQKDQSSNLNKSIEQGNTQFKNLLERQFQRYNQLKQIVQSVTSRIKKLSQDINGEFSLSQNSQTMQNIVKMLQSSNNQKSKNYQSFSRSNYSQTQSFDYDDDQQVQIEPVMDQFEIILKSFLLKYAETNKLYKQSLEIKKHMDDELKSYKQELKQQKKSMALLQKLLQKNQTQRNQLLNQIQSTVPQKELQLLKNKSKQEIIQQTCKLTYRIKDLEKQKEAFMKSSTKDKEKQLQMYEALYYQVKGIKEKSRLRQSMA